MNFSNPILSFAVLLLATTAHAQSKDPFDPNTPVASTSYQSAFADYRGYQDPDIASWTQTNESVGQGGGHSNHGGHAQSRPSQGSAKTGGSTPPLPMPDHSGMHQK